MTEYTNQNWNVSLSVLDDMAFKFNTRPLRPFVAELEFVACFCELETHEDVAAVALLAQRGGQCLAAPAAV